MKAFRSYMENYTRVSDKEWEIIREHFSRREYARNEMILTEGSICRYFWFLEQGLVRFYIHRDGEELTRFFTAAPYCFTSKDSFRNRLPATENIQALEKTVVWQISLDDSNKLLAIKAWETFTRNFLHEVQSKMEELLLEMVTESVESRYLRLKEKYPELVAKIPLKHLSGFLGIAPQSLSRIRKKQKISGINPG
ncbi:MAG: Crp/Fnr family transcriptional regulator [Bacteroidota bacterium]